MIDIAILLPFLTLVGSLVLVGVLLIRHILTSRSKKTKFDGSTRSTNVRITSTTSTTSTSTTPPRWAVDYQSAKSINSLKHPGLMFSDPIFTFRCNKCELWGEYKPVGEKYVVAVCYSCKDIAVAEKGKFRADFF